MQIITPGGPFVAPRKSASSVINPLASIKPVRVRLLVDCVLWTNALGRAGDVIEFDTSTPEGHEAVAFLTSHSTAGQRVPLSTPLFTAPAPALPLAVPTPEKKDSSVVELAKALLAAMQGSQLKASKA